MSSELQAIIASASNPAEAIELLMPLREVFPDRAAMEIQLGKLMLAEKRVTEAIAALEGVLSVDATQKEAAVLLTEAHLRSENAAAAEAVWPPVMAAFPDDATLRTSVASIFAHYGAAEAAERFVDLAEPLEDNPATIAHLRAAIRGEAPEKPDMSHVRDLFDRAAQKYDASLSAVRNRGPEIAQMMLTVCDVPVTGRMRVLDAGCGTGLCGHFLKPLAAELIGVDLSQGMLDEAEKTGFYDSLQTCDISDPAELPPGKFDLILCADVLVYFGDLRQVVTLMAERLNYGGWLIFSVEAAPEDLGEPGYLLQVSGRYKHSEDHAQGAIQAAGLNIATFAETPDMRYEMRQPVAAHVAVCRKPLPPV